MFSGNGLTITAAGTPLENAAIGDFIRVRNIESGLIVSGTVMDNGSIRVAAEMIRRIAKIFSIWVAMICLAGSGPGPAMDAGNGSRSVEDFASGAGLSFIRPRPLRASRTLPRCRQRATTSSLATASSSALQGTGDGLRNSPFTEQSLRAMLQNLGISTEGGASRANNVAAVIVTANLPPFASWARGSMSRSPLSGTPPRCAAARW
jgi:hypothetical protein